MKKYLLKIALFFVIVAVVDFCYGTICDYLRDHAKGGIAAKVHYIIEDCHEDVIMMGFANGTSLHTTSFRRFIGSDLL